MAKSLCRCPFLWHPSPAPAPATSTCPLLFPLAANHQKLRACLFYWHVNLCGSPFHFSGPVSPHGSEWESECSFSVYSCILYIVCTQLCFVYFINNFCSTCKNIYTPGKTTGFCQILAAHKLVHYIFFALKEGQFVRHAIDHKALWLFN